MSLSAGKGHHSFKELRVIGYAGDVSHNEVPCVVPPIFGYKEVEGMCLYPPFDYVNDLHGVVGGTSIETASLIKQQTVTFLRTPKVAKPGYLLAVRKDGVWYSAQGNVLSWMTAYSETQAVASYRYFIGRENENARYFARRSLNADDSNLTAMEVLGAVYWSRRQYGKASPLIKEAKEIDKDLDLRQRIKRLIHERDGTKERLSATQERALKRLFGRRVPAKQFKKNTLQSLEQRGLVEVLDGIAGLSWRGEDRLKPNPKQLEGFR